MPKPVEDGRRHVVRSQPAYLTHGNAALRRGTHREATSQITRVGTAGPRILSRSSQKCREGILGTARRDSRHSTCCDDNRRTCETQHSCTGSLESAGIRAPQAPARRTARRHWRTSRQWHPPPVDTGGQAASGTRRFSSPTRGDATFFNRLLSGRAAARCLRVLHGSRDGRHHPLRAEISHALVVSGALRQPAEVTRRALQIKPYNVLQTAIRPGTTWIRRPRQAH